MHHFGISDIPTRSIIHAGFWIHDASRLELRRMGHRSSQRETTGRRGWMASSVQRSAYLTSPLQAFSRMLLSTRVSLHIASFLVLSPLSLSSSTHRSGTMRDSHLLLLSETDSRFDFFWKTCQTRGTVIRPPIHKKQIAKKKLYVKIWIAWYRSRFTWNCNDSNL